MPKKSLYFGITLLVILGLAGAFLLSPKQARADIAISSELGGGDLGGDIAISDEIGISPDNGEGSFVTPPIIPPPSGGGGGGGHRRISPKIPPTILGTSTVCVYPYLTKYIKFGAANDPVEVVKLQRFLHDNQGFLDVEETGIYDQTTLTAVMVFQRRYAQDVLLPWGLTAEQPTGYVFITTSLVINRLYCGFSTQHNLDLRNVYGRGGGETPAVKPREGGKEAAGGPVIVIQPTVPTTTATSLIPYGGGNTQQAAAVGFLTFLKDNLWYWLIPLLILILILGGYYLWRERTVKRRRDEDDEDLSSQTEQDEVRIHDEDEASLE